MKALPGVWWLIAAGAVVVGLRAEEARAWNPHWLGVLGEERALLQAAREYRKQYGTYPATDAQSTWAEKLIDAELDGGLVGEVSPGVYSRELVDRWGTPYVYIPPADLHADPEDADHQPRIGSFGDNGVDDGEAGDDLWFDRGVNDGWYCYAHRPRMRGFLWVFGAGLAAIVIATAFRPGLRRTLAVILPAYLSLAYIICAPMSHTAFWVYTYSFGPWRLVYWLSWWILLGTVVAGPLRALARMIRARSIVPGACVSCGYSLVGLPRSVVYCPECGAVRAGEASTG